MKKFITFLIAIFVCFSLPISLFGWETDWFDREWGLTNFRLHGYFWVGFDSIDSQKGVVDTGPTQGFTLSRIFVRIDGRVKEGRFKDWRYHITLEGDALRGSNDFRRTFFKFAFFSFPIVANLNMIVGLQNTPTTTGGRYNLESIWRFRYLDEEGRSMWDQVGITTTSDIGAGLEFISKYFLGYLLFAHGEGVGKRNAQDIRNKTLPDLARGAGDSYGYSIYGRGTLMPLGDEENQPLMILLHIPFFYENVMGVHRTEYEYFNKIDFIKGEWEILRGSPKAKRDESVGWELDTLLRGNNLRFTLGVGQIYKKDRRKASYKIDSSLLKKISTQSFNPLDFLNQNYFFTADAYGWVNYIYFHTKLGEWSLVARYYLTTDNGNHTGRLQPQERISVLNQFFLEDYKENGVIGDVNLEKLVQWVRSEKIDFGKSRFSTTLIALEYSPNARLRVAIGGSEKTSTTKNGDPYKITPLQARNIGSYTQNNFSQWIVNQFALPNFLQDKDLIGARKVDRQYFIKSQIDF
ncbi:MAG: hypothetical protein NZ853_00190 [Leptospiraceae bacterium]|nr:hypothetical protein [Leptospiraceae bacterium]MDW7976352.1 hypothetical protein [Leptospiraceae bacterium]